MSSELQSVPCVLMRGGTSKGPFFLASDLPTDPHRRNELLLDVMGAGHPLQIDGIGGGHALSSKVAIIDRASRPDADVDYLFAQVRLDHRRVDMAPNCGNMLAAVGPFAIEAGLVPAQHPQTQVRIHNVNTGKLIVAVVQTPGGRVKYHGATSIAGAPGSAAPISLSFVDAAGARTGQLLPTGLAVQRILGVDVTCIDCAMPLVLAPAVALGLHGDESPAQLDSNNGLLLQLERIRVEAGHRMGIADAAGSVIPKPVVISPPLQGGTLQVRYFMPQRCHPALAITGAVGIATACLTPGTGAWHMAGQPSFEPVIRLEHPSGMLDVHMRREHAGGPLIASVTRTARRLFEGRVFTTLPLDVVAQSTAKLTA